MLEDLLHCGNTKRSSIGGPPFTALCTLVEHDPEMIGARSCLNSDLGNIHIEQAQHIGRQMDKAIIAISSLGPCSILIVSASSYLSSQYSDNISRAFPNRGNMRKCSLNMVTPIGFLHSLPFHSPGFSVRH